MGVSREKCRNFVDTVNTYYRRHGRSFPWRQTHDPYAILVSEVMLQQTQATRVVPFYLEFLKHFPTIKTLARAPLREVLQVWQGLGYNRRATYLKRGAEVVLRDYQGTLPRTAEALRTIPGIGPYTASAILVFAYNLPTVLLETNVRTAYIHHFFPRTKQVRDARLLPLIKTTMDRKNGREWWNAVMDYGAMLKATVGNKGRQSKHFMTQSRFKGSRRQIRGLILSTLLNHRKTIVRLKKEIASPHFDVALQALLREGVLKQTGRLLDVA